jgi:hypothetical protein
MSEKIQADMAEPENILTIDSPSVHTHMPKFSIYENETSSELKDRLTSYRELTSPTQRDWRDFPTVHHPKGNKPTFIPSEWHGRGWTKRHSDGSD